jgi:hypothetical protein
MEKVQATNARAEAALTDSIQRREELTRAVTALCATTREMCPPPQPPPPRRSWWHWVCG